jgi:ribonuclease P protein component
MSEHRFPKRVRLLRASEFERVFAARASAVNSWMAMYGVANGLDYPRLGITVSRRVGVAVVRNRWKRLLREAFRLTQPHLPGLDLVCVARAHQPPDLKQMMDAFSSLAGRIELRLNQSTRATLEKKS